MSAAEKWEFRESDRLACDLPAKYLARQLATPTSETIARVVGHQGHYVSSADGLRHAHVELHPYASFYRLAFGGALEYRAKFRATFNRLFTKLADRPQLSDDVDEARSRYDDLAAVGFELHHNATEHGDAPTSSPTRVLALSYNSKERRLKLEVSDLGPGIVTHYSSSILGGVRSQNMAPEEVLGMLLQTHESAIPSRSLGGGLPNVLVLCDKLRGTWSVETNMLAASADAQSKLNVVPSQPNIGTHWEIEIPCR